MLPSSDSLTTLPPLALPELPDVALPPLALRPPLPPVALPVVVVPPLPPKSIEWTGEA